MKLIFSLAIFFSFSIVFAGSVEITSKPKVQVEPNSAKIQDALSNMLNSITNGVGNEMQNGVNLAKREIPLVLEEIISYGRIKHPLHVLACIIVILSSFIFYIKYVRKWEWDSYDHEARDVTRVIGLTIIGILNMIVIIICIGEIGQTIKVYCAPRVYLIQYAIQLARIIK